MKIEGKLTLDRLEEALSAATSADAGNLFLPGKSKVAGIGVEPSLIQASITWARNHPSESLELNLPQDSESRSEKIEQFVRKQPVGLVACSMAGNVTALGEQVEVAITQPIRTHLASFRETTSNPDQLSLFETGNEDWSEEAITAMGPKLFLPCVDHFDNGRIPHLYIDDDSLRTKPEFRALIRILLRKLESSSPTQSDRRNPFSPELMEGIGTIAYELFDNTHRWAVKDEDGRRYVKSNRGVLLRLHDVSERAADETPQSPIDRYLARQSFGQPLRRVIEISIFDSGPGLAARMMKQRVGEQVPTFDEFGAICDCFKKHRTTSGQPGRGLGLHYLMETLTKFKGFVRLRTGRLCLYRDLIEHTVDIYEGHINRAMHDWYGNQESPTKLSNASGAAFTILLPLV